MYIERIIEVGKASNGLIISCNVPLKKDAKATSKMESCGCGDNCQRQYIAKDAKEAGDIIADLMPLLDQDFTTEDAFDKAFDSAVNDMESPTEDTEE
jgi:hypothetical protein